MDLHKALIYYCRENKAPYFVGETYDTLRWDSDNIPKPTEAELEQAWEDYLVFRAANQYRDQRAKEYPSIADQFDSIYHGGLDDWKASIKAIKDKYPKPS